MVLDKEEKSDVFAPFRLSGEVQDIENKWMEKDIQENRTIASSNGKNTPKEDVFAKFRLSDAAREDAKRLRLASSDQKTEEQGSVSQNQPSKSSFDFFSRIVNARRRGRIKKEYEKNNSDPEGEKAEEMEDAIDANPPLQQVSFGDDNDRMDGDAASPRDAKESATLKPSGATDLLGSQFWWESPANDIFSDFDLSAIVRDYEKLQRKVNYPPTKHVQDSADEEQEPLKSRLDNFRYKNLKQWWLDNFPRCHGFIFRVLIPQWIILLMAMGLGFILAEFEIGDEYKRNDAVLAGRFTLEQFPRDEAIQFLFGLPTVCFNIYVAAKGRPANISEISDGTFRQQGLDEWFGSKFPPVSPGFSGNIEETIEEIENYMEVCEDTAAKVTTQLVAYMSLRGEDIFSNAALTFDWIRCWNTSIYGEVNPFRPTAAQKEAAKRQADFYTEVWMDQQVKLYNEYLVSANCTSFACRKRAFDRSIEDATGSSMCNLNNGAAAWFWFTVMTTVGYGNQAPVTDGGRTLVACLAWVSIITWGMILFVAGQVVSIIMDDFFRKCRMRCMTRDLPSAVFWGFLAFIWILIMSELASLWWSRSADREVDRADALWWAYISILTVGLGDVYLDPEFVFFQDLFLWAFIFLIGFTFLSTFLNQMSDLCNGIFPDSGEALKERLRNTNLVGLRAVHYKEKNTKALQNIGELVEKMDDDSVGELLLRLTRIRQKKELLIHLLFQTQDELDYFANRGENYEDPPLPRVAEEENMLSEVLEKTSREREKLERYRDRIQSDAMDETISPAIATACQKEDRKVTKKGKLPVLASLVFGVMVLAGLPCAHSSSPSTGFPGIIPSNPSQANSNQSNSRFQNDQSSLVNNPNFSDDDGGESELEGSNDESSSEWDEPLVPTYDNNNTVPKPLSSTQNSEITDHLQDKRVPPKIRIVGKGKSVIPNAPSSKLDTSRGPSNKPMRTLEKLQQLLDETDYMTTSSSAISSFQDESGSDNESSSASKSWPSSATSPVQGIDTLWTRKDRYKYKKQQYFQEQLQRQQQAYQQNSDIEDVSDTDDGLGYTLPNLPVYLSDDEGDTSTSGHPSVLPLSQPNRPHPMNYPPLTSQQQQQAAAALAHQQFLQQQRDLYLAQQQYHQQLQMLQQQQQQQLYQPYHPNPQYQDPHSFPNPQYPPVYHTPQNLVSPTLQEQNPKNQHFVPQIPNSPKSFQQPLYSLPHVGPGTIPMRPDPKSVGASKLSAQSTPIAVAGNDSVDSISPVAYLVPSPHPNGYQVRRPSMATRIWKAFLSIQRVLFCAGLAAIVAYAAVSPRSLHFVEYNQKFYENVRRVTLVVLPPLFLYGWAAVDWTGGYGKFPTYETAHLIPPPEWSKGSNPVHHLIRAMSRSFTAGYVTTFVLEIVLTTFLRLAVFAWWEPGLFAPPFSTSVDVDNENPSLGATSLGVPPPAWLILPWVLRERKLRVKRITLLVADFLTSCVASPIVEEVAKLILLQWTIRLPKNFKWVRRTSKHQSKDRMVAEPISADVSETSEGGFERIGQRDGLVTYINPYISGMLAVSLGLKWADAIRRVCMYTKAKDEHKALYALLRGLFPVQELCGCMTALRLARRDVLGQNMPLWSIVLPSVVVHGMANFRGMKPFFKWNSASPWSEMQLSRDTFSSETLSVLGGSTSSANKVHVSASGVKNFARWLGKEFPRITWLIILFRVAGYCVKNYYMINRQAYKRISTYKGKHAAFSAELETAQKLKQTAKEKKK